MIAQLMRFLDANPVADWIALAIVLVGIVCLSAADWRRSRQRPRPRS